MNGGKRLRPGMRTRKSVNRDTTRSAGDEKREGAPSTVINLEELSQTHIPMAAMSERWMDPRVRTSLSERRCRMR